MNGSVLPILLAFVLLVPTTLVYGQDKLMPTQIEKLTEVEQLRVQLSVEKQKRIQAEAELALIRAQAEQAAILQALFAVHHVDGTKFRLNPETGEFIAVTGAATTTK